MRHYALPILGAIAAAIGTFSPLAMTPAGPALAFAGIAGLLTLWRSRGGEGHAIRKRAFFCALLVGFVAAVAGQVFLSAPKAGLEAWVARGLTTAYVAAFVVVVVMIYYIWFAARHRARGDAARSTRAKVLSFVASTVTASVFAGVAVSIIAFAVQMSAQSVYVSLTPPAAQMIDAMGEARKPASEQIVRDGEALRVTASGTTFAWDCAALDTLTVDDVAHPTGEADKMLLGRICQD